jgi:EAL domain-containing protein (putative c-di-GMP-specific phosphodiesterase class I)
MPSKRSTRDEVQIHQDANRQAPVLFVGNPLPMRIYDVQTLRFLEANGSAAPVLAAVNVSPLQLMRSDIVAEVREAISQSGIGPIWLEMEITERVALNFDEIAMRMEHLAEMGIRFAMDDFSTGYSSFQHLDRLPISTLKIDRSFIQQLSEASRSYPIVQAIIAMGHSLQMQIIAEGVEQEDQ